jgi:hypothetical protein
MAPEFFVLREEISGDLSRKYIWSCYTNIHHNNIPSSYSLPVQRRKEVNYVIKTCEDGTFIS